MSMSPCKSSLFGEWNECLQSHYSLLEFIMQRLLSRSAHQLLELARSHCPHNVAHVKRNSLVTFKIERRKTEPNERDMTLSLTISTSEGMGKTVTLLHSSH